MHKFEFVEKCGLFSYTRYLLQMFSTKNDFVRYLENK